MGIMDWFDPKRKRKDVESFLIKLHNQRTILEASRFHRKEKRLPVVLAIRVVPFYERQPDVSSCFTSAIHDVSTYGISFTNSRRFLLGDPVIVSIELEKKYYHFQGVVRHSTPIGFDQNFTGVELSHRLDAIADLPDPAPTEVEKA